MFNCTLAPSGSQQNCVSIRMCGGYGYGILVSSMSNGLLNPGRIVEEEVDEPRLSMS